MKIALTLRRSKLARHILMLFLICALLPLLSLLIFPYYQITQHHTEQVFRMLRQNNNVVSFSIYERLLLLETEMRFSADHLFDSGSGQVLEPIIKSQQLDINHFKALGLINNQGLQHQISGIFENPPSLELDRNLPFDNNKARILVQEIANGQPAVFMLVGLEKTEFGNRFLIAEINPDFLWNSGAADGLPRETEICVLDASGQFLTTTIPQPRGLLSNLDHIQNNSARGQFKWNHAGSQYLASSRVLFLQSRFQVPGWTIVSSQSKADALPPGLEFKIISPLVLLLSILIALLFSINHVRKILTSLEKLKNGTHLVAEGKFKNRVDINSGDEFEELATDFNLMSESLNYQFKELSILAKIGSTMANILSKDSLAQAASSAIEKYLDFDRGMILMANEHNNRLYFVGGFGYRDEDIRQFKKFEFKAFDNQPNDPISSAFIGQKPISFSRTAGTATERPEAQNLFIKSTGSRYIICRPIVYERESLGVLVLERENPQGSNGCGDDKLLTGVVSHLAVRLSNIISYNKLMQSEARFRKSFDYAASGIALLDLKGYFMDVNEYFLNMLGYSEHEIFGHTIFEICHTDETEIILASLQRLSNGEIEFASYEQRFLRGDGNTCWSLVSTSLLHDSEGSPLHYIALYQDLTDKKMTEKENVKLQSRLQQAQKMEAIGTLAGGIAHDFNNILSGIMGYAQLGMMENDRDSDTYRWLQGVQEAGDRASELVKQILTFSRQGKQEKVPIQIHLIVKEALKLLKATLPFTIDIQEKISNKSGVVLADSTQIHQLVMNICTNAYHSMLDESGILEVTLQPEHLNPDTTSEQFDLQPGPYLRLTISDTGCGMDDATVDKIFDPYFTTKEPEKGTGLGLSVVHGIVESHGGAISVQSEPGQGTRFEVLFPQMVVDQQSVRKSVESIPTGTEKILFVDDEGAIAETAKSLLEKIGYRVEAYTDPQRAFDEFTARKDYFDLVITDMSMPHLTGEELSTRLLEIRPDIPILMCTGYSDKVNAANPQAIGIKKVLIKPLEMSKLANIIRQVLDEDAGSLAS
jgi:PAS domain S-box-containing protein